MGYIYKIINCINRKVYVGQTIQPPYLRWSKHLRNIADEDCQMEIVKAMRELGWENFSFKIIEEVPNENLDNREYYWSQYFDCYNNGYNTNFPKGYNMESQTELRNCKKICQLNNNSEIIAIYNSTREAVKTIFPDATEEEIKTKMKCISAVARGNRKSAYGFKWKYSFKENIN